MFEFWSEEICLISGFFAFELKKKYTQGSAEHSLMMTLHCSRAHMQSSTTHDISLGHLFILQCGSLI